MLLWVQAGLGAAAIAAHLAPVAVGLPHLLLPTRSLLAPILATASAAALLTITHSRIAIHTPGLVALAALPLASIPLAVLPPRTTAIGWTSYGPAPEAWRLDLALRSTTVAAWLTLATLLTAVICLGLLLHPAARAASDLAPNPDPHPDQR